MMFLLLCVLAAGCSTSRDVETPDWLPAARAADRDLIASKTRLAPHPQAGWSEVLGPVAGSSWPSVRRFMIRSWIDPGGPRDNAFQLQLQAGFPRRVYLKQVHAEGREMPTTVIDRERADCGYGCAVIETVGVALDEADMERLAISGLSLEVIGRRETIRMSVPAPYFAAVLEFHRAQRPP